MAPHIPLLDEFSGSITREISAGRYRAIDSMIYLTYRCTSRCKTCNIWKRNAEGSQDTELGWDQWRVILGRLSSYGIKSLEIFGGDALLRKDIIYDVIAFCRDKGMETFFPTNSLLLDREAARRLVASGLGTIYFSLDDVDVENDRIRGQKGAFELVARAMENLCRERGRGAGPKIIVCTTISNMNYDHFERVADFLRDFPVDALYPRVVCEFSRKNIEESEVEGIRPEPYFVTTEDTSHLLTREQVLVFKESLQRARLKGRGGKSLYINSRAVEAAGDDAFIRGRHPEKKCLVCSTFVTIDPLGNVTPCPMFNRYSIGNLLESSLCEIWGNAAHRKFVSAQREGAVRICSNCVMRGYYPTLSETCAHYLRKTMARVAS